MPTVVAVVGNSNAGKTRVAASLVAALSARGFRVAAIKHCPHGHDLDRPGSDTDLLYRAGAATVLAVSPDRVTTVQRAAGDASLEALVASLDSEVDIVVAEGFKSSVVPKVLVVRGDGPPPSVENVIATVTDRRGAATPGDVPSYGFEEVDRLASQLCERAR